MTAVDFLMNKLKFIDKNAYNELYEYYEQAKEMEKLQHGNTWDEAIDTHERRGHVIARSLVDFDDYFKETYESNTNL